MNAISKLNLQIENIYKLTPLQLGVLFHTMYAPDGAAYFEQIFCRLDGDVDLQSLKRALELLSQRYAILRTAIVTKGQRDPRQVVFKNAPIPLIVRDWRDSPAATRQAALVKLLDRDRLQGFRLNRPPLMRIMLVRFGECEWWLVWSYHHLLLDGWSVQLLLRDFFELVVNGHAGPVPNPFSDYLAWLDRQPREDARAFWSNTLGDLTSPTPLGIDRLAAIDAVKDFAESRHSITLPGLTEAAAACQVSMGTILLGAWAVLLGRYAGQDEVTFGLTLSGRAIKLQGVDRMVGLLINTLPLRLQLPRHRMLADWLTEVQQAQFALLPYSYCGLSEIHACSSVASGSPLFESLVAIDNFPLGDLQVSEQLPFEVSSVDMMERTNYPISLTMVPNASGVSLKLGYDRSRVSDESATALAANYEHLLSEITTKSGLTVGKWAACLGWAEVPAARVDLLEGAEFTSDLCTLFESSVSRHGARPAVSYERQILSYVELDEAANRLAWRLLELGVGVGEQESLVGLSAERGLGLVVGVLGILKAGGTYVPLDPAYPSERLAYLVKDSGVQVVVGDTAGWAALGEAGAFRRVCLDEQALELRSDAPPRRLHPQQAAYVIYTSGSTGQPKGCVVSHANVVRLFAATRDHGFSTKDVWTLFHSYAFDFSVWEVWGALLHGGRLVVVPYLVSRDPEQFAQLLEAERVSVLSQTPAAFRQLLEVSLDHAYTDLRLVVFGGEVLEPDSLKPWYARHGDRVRLVNMYGITETTVHVTEKTLAAAGVEQATSVIGEPLKDLSLQVLDRYGEPVPTGVAGEIYVGGAGVTRGYLGRAALTAQRFVPDPYGPPGARLYRSGDVARQLPDGGLVYLGRADRQIKLRGFRIEPGEVEAALRAQEGVQDAVVMLNTPAQGAPRLVAYVTGAVEPLALHGGLSQRLPGHMVPALIMPLECFPLTDHGKLDCKALPKPVGNNDLYVEPRTPEQKALATIWQEVLGTERVGINDNYFALGGDSIRSIRIVSQAEAKGIRLSIEDLFQKLTIERLTEDLVAPVLARREPEAFALLVEEDRWAAPADAVDGYPLSELQAGMLFHAGYGDGRQLYHDIFSYRLEIALDPKCVRQRLRQLFAAHPVLRTSFALSGYSRPVQWVHAKVEPSMVVEDLLGLCAAARSTAVGRAQERLRDELFDPATPPLLRLLLQRLEENQWQVSFAIHHVILDGWSVASLLADMLRVEAPVPARDHVFRNFVALELQALSSEEERVFWQRQLQDMPVTSLTRWPLETVQQGRARSCTHESHFPPVLYQALAELARRQGSTLKSVLLALHARVLAHWSGEREVVTGLVTNGRPEEKHGAEALGLFLNTLPIRLETRHARWTALLEAVRQAEGEQLAHRRFPMAELRRLHRSSSLFETTFNFVDFHVYQDVVSKGGDLTARILEVSSVQSFDIPMGTSFTVDRDQGLLHLTLSYDAALFPPAQAQAIAATYLRAAEALVSGSDEAYAGLVLASTQELTDIELRGQGRSARAQPPSVIQAVRAAACRRPWALAVQSIAGDLDYATLDRRSSELATHLLAAGLQPDRPVALLLNRSPEMVIAMLAVLKAACPYVPLVAGLPARRLTEIFEDVRPQATLILNALRSELPTQAESGRLLIVDALPELPQPPPLSEPHEATLAYVLFTSGSTGRPKGISIPVKALANHMAWMQRCFPLAEDDRVLQKTSVGFDASIWEFWAPLMAGATLVLAEESVQRDANALLETIQMRAITVLQLVPSVLDILLELSELADCKSLRRVFVGGEALQASTIGRFEAVLGLPLINLYGPTEATIDSSYASYRGNEGAAVSIGEPIDGASLYVFDDRLQPVGLGIYGELWIGGIGLARGYWRRAAETAASFLPDHLSAQPGSRMYRTGDIVRWLPDGGLQYAGRRDSQIKLRGNRIELTEIEAALARQPGVTRSAVLARKDARGQVQLVAYVLGQGAPAQKFILSSLSLFLPDYMLPQRIVRITTWPLTPNGKTDYGALPASEPPTDRAESVASQPANQLELELTTVWSKLLASSKIGVTDNFFELGGDSILAMQIAAEMRRRGYVMVPRQLFEQPTVRALAAVLTPRQATTTPALEAPIGPLPLSPSQRWFFDLELSKRAHWNQAVMLRVPSQLQPHRLHKALSAVVAAHDAFRLRFSPVGDGWVQRLAVDAGDWYASVDFSGLAVGERGAALTALAEQAQRSLELGHGPLLKAVHVDYGLGEAGFLLLVIHHLIVDGVSWRVLLYDLNLTLDGHNVQPPTVGFGPWLAAQAECAVAEQVRAYWLKQAEYVAVMGRVPRSGQVAPEGRYGQAQTIEQLFDREATLRLLGEAQMRLKARPVELLLTAVAGALRGWAYNGRLAVTMEGHGRDNGYEWQLERTVGWFTVLYPLVCELEGTADGPATLLRIKKALRSVPDGGVGYGRLRAQGVLGQLPLPEISFNYLGQFEDDGADGSLTVVAESVGDSEDPEGRRPHVLDIVALIQAGQLRLRWVFDDRAPERATIAVLAATAAERLRELLTSENVCSAWGADDFPLAGVDTKSLPLALGEHGQQLVDLWKTTPTQEGMLFHSRLEGDTSAVYLEQVVVQLYGDIDANLLARAWNEVAARHDALRSAFVWEGLGRPLQRIWRSVEVPFEEVELDEGTDNDVLDAFLERDRRRGLTLTIAPLMRISLLRRCRRAWRLVWTHHHAVLDGWSMALVFAELAKCYQALTHGETSPMVSAPSYGDYVRWLEQMPREQISERFWSDYLNGLDTVSLFGREPQKTSMHDWLSMSLPLSQVERLHTLAARYQVTLNTLVQSAYAVALSRLSGHRKVVFGVTVSGRPSELMEVERMVGLFIITLPMLVDCAGDVSIGDLFGRVQATQGAIEHHAFVRAVDIQRWSGLAADQPLFDSVLVYENYPIDRSLADLSHNLGIGTVVARDHPHYAFSLYVKPSASELVLEAVFDPQRVERSRADLMLGGVRYLLKQLADGIGHVGALQLAELPPATALETRAVDPDILALIRHMAETGPGRRAVSAPDRNLSYSELLTVSRAFAAQLLDHGVRPGMCVAIGLGRSADMLVALLGVLWAGAQYVPVDPALPAIRRTMILQDAIPHLVVVDAATEPAFAGHPLLHYAVGDRAVAALPGDTLPPRALAYTIFTSGSTGRPKGVQINHGALANILIHFRTTPGLSAEDRLLAVTTLSFDIAALELFLPLCCGSEVVIASTEDAANGRALGDIIARHQISVMQATPASWRLLLAADWRPPKGFRAWCGGEALPLELTRDLLSLGIELWNVYGPTETTIWSAVSKVEAPLAMPLPVGGPIRGTALYVLDADGQRLPEGVNGQLAIGGDGLATGYLRDPRQTAKYFRPDPFSGRDGDRLYLTGDLARTRRDGSFEVVGRFDNQVKLNGFRIELGDVEAALRTLHGVRNAAVVVHTSAGYEHLVAYLEPTNDAPDDSTWREALVASLPRYMLPAQLIRLQALPLTPNGKLDRRTLPKPDLAEHSAAKLEPVGAVETAMCAIWSEVFMIEEISVDDDFYALGGHSLLATQIHTRLVRIFRISLPLGEVFRATTPRALAAVVDAYADPAWATKIAKAYLHLLSLSPEQQKTLRNNDGMPPKETTA